MNTLQRLVAAAALAVLVTAPARAQQWHGPEDPQPPKSPAPALLDIVLTTEARLHGLLRDEFSRLRVTARRELTRRVKHADDPTERWLAGALLTRHNAPRDEIERLSRSWREAVAAVAGSNGSEYHAMFGRRRVDTDKLPQSDLWPALLADWAAFGWDGTDPLESSYTNGEPCMELLRFHALLALAGRGDTNVIPLLARHVPDTNLRDEQRTALGVALAGLRARGSDDVLKSTPLFGHNSDAADPRLVPHLLRRAVTEGTGTAVGGWANAVALERIRGAHPKEFERRLAEEAEVVLAYDGAKSLLRHASGQATGTTWTAKPGRDGAGHIVFGPYTGDLPAGRYLARFRVRLRGYHPSARQLELDVAHDDGRRRVANRSVGGWSVSEDQWKDFFVAFETPGGDARTEFRVHWDGRCEADVASIAVFRVRPAEGADPAVWVRPDLTVRPLDERVATARHLLVRATRSHDREYVALRAALDLLPEARDAALSNVARVAPERVTATLLRARAADPAAWDALTARFAPTVESASSVGWGHITGAWVEWQLAIDIDRTVAIEGEAGDVAGVPPRTVRGEDQWRYGARLPASDLWPGVLAEIALHDVVRDLYAGPFRKHRRRPPPPPRDPSIRVPTVEEFDAEVVAALRFHATLHGARVGDLAARERLRAMAVDEEAPTGRRAAALATLALLEPDGADALLEQHAGDGAETALCGRVVGWLDAYRVVAARPYLWRRLGSGIVDGMPRWPVEWARTDVAGALGVLRSVHPAESAAFDAALLEPVAALDLPETAPDGARLWVEFKWTGDLLPDEGPLVVRVTATASALDPAIWEVRGECLSTTAKAVLGLETLDAAGGTVTLLGALPLPRTSDLTFRVSVRERRWGRAPHERPLAVIERVEILRLR